jgi:toxin ParE1/3/4
MVQLIIKPLALQDLEEIWLYTFQTWSIQQADFYQDQLYYGMQLLSENNKIAKNISLNAQAYLYYKVNHHYIFFRIENKQLIVIRILHEKMDFVRHL